MAPVVAVKPDARGLITAGSSTSSGACREQHARRALAAGLRRLVYLCREEAC